MKPMVEAEVIRFNLPFNVHVGRRTRLAMRYGGFALFATLLFLFALQFAFPYERLRDRAVDALAANYDLQVGEVERGLVPGRVYFHDVSIRGRPTKADEVVTPLFIRQLQVDVSLLALLRRSASIDFEAMIGDAKNGIGTVAGNITLPGFGKSGINIDVEGKELPGGSLPLRSVLGLPIVGKIDFAFRLGLPTINKANRRVFDWRKADGEIELSCPSRCTIGDGRTKLKPLLQDRNNQAMVADGIDFGKLDVDSLIARAAFIPEVGNPDARSSSYKPGKFELQKFEIKSPDGELHVDYAMTMAQEFGDSVVAGCLRYKANERLLQKDETKRTYAAISTIGAELRADGLFHVRLTERFKEMRRLNQECGPSLKAATSGGDVRNRAGSSRPGLGAVDGSAPRPGAGIAPTPTPEPAPAPAGVPPPTAVPASGTTPVPAGMPGSTGVPSSTGMPGSPGTPGSPGMTADGMPVSAPSAAAAPTGPAGSPGPSATPEPPGMPGAPATAVEGSGDSSQGAHVQDHPIR